MFLDATLAKKTPPVPAHNLSVAAGGWFGPDKHTMSETFCHLKELQSCTAKTSLALSWGWLLNASSFSPWPTCQGQCQRFGCGLSESIGHRSTNKARLTAKHRSTNPAETQPTAPAVPGEAFQRRLPNMAWYEKTRGLCLRFESETTNRSCCPQEWCSHDPKYLLQGFCQRRKCQSEGGKEGWAVADNQWAFNLGHGGLNKYTQPKGLPMTSPKALTILIAKNGKLLLLFAVHLASEHMCPHNLRITFHVKKQRQLKRWASMDSRLLWQFWVLRICSSAEGRTELLQLPHFGHLGRPQLDKLNHPFKRPTAGCVSRSFARKITRVHWCQIQFAPSQISSHFYRPKSSWMEWCSDKALLSHESWKNCKNIGHLLLAWSACVNSNTKIKKRRKGIALWTRKWNGGFMVQFKKKTKKSLSFGPYTSIYQYV